MLGKPRRNKNLKIMTESERIEHLKQLNRDRRNRCYRKKILQQQNNKQNEPKITIQKIDWCNNCIIEDDNDIDSIDEDTKTLTELYEYIAEEPNDKEVLEAIGILEDKLEIDENEKLNTNGDFDSDSDSD